MKQNTKDKIFNWTIAVLLGLVVVLLFIVSLKLIFNIDEI